MRRTRSAAASAIVGVWWAKRTGTACLLSWGSSRARIRNELGAVSRGVEWLVVDTVCDIWRCDELSFVPGPGLEFTPQCPVVP